MRLDPGKVNDILPNLTYQLDLVLSLLRYTFAHSEYIAILKSNKICISESWYNIKDKLQSDTWGIHTHILQNIC